MIPEIAYVHQAPDRREPESTMPTHDSIVRARAAQRLEREAFTESTGIRVNRNGKMMIPKFPRRVHPTIC